jgi:hypothetical protein
MHLVAGQSREIRDRHAASDSPTASCARGGGGGGAKSIFLVPPLAIATYRDLAF